MGLIAFDTIEYSRKLQDAGMPQPQADAIARAQREMFADVLEQKELATKVDIVLLQKDMSELRTELKGDMSELRTELKGEMADLRKDMADLRTELKGDMAELRTELKGDMAELRTEVKGDMAGLRKDMAEMESRIMKGMYNGLFGFAAAIAAIMAVTVAWLK